MFDLNKILKWDEPMKHAVRAGLLFLLLSVPVMWELTEKIMRPIFGVSTFARCPDASVVEQVCPTLPGVVLHGLVFLVVTRLLHEHDKKQSAQKSA